MCILLLVFCKINIYSVSSTWGLVLSVWGILSYNPVKPTL